MDSAALVAWRAVIGFLTAAQQGSAFFDLAFAEADDPIERRDDEIGETAQPDKGMAGVAVAPIVEEKPEPELLSKVGRDRIAGLGCPHCGDFAIGAWGLQNGMPTVSLQGLPKDVHSVDGDALVRIGFQGSLDRSGASLDLRGEFHREGGGALRDRSHDSGVPVASSISFPL